MSTEVLKSVRTVACHSSFVARPIPTDGPEGTQRVSEHPWPVAGKSEGPFQHRLAMSSPQRLPSVIEAVVALLRTQGGNEMGMHRLECW